MLAAGGEGARDAGCAQCCFQRAKRGAPKRGAGVKRVDGVLFIPHAGRRDRGVQRREAVRDGARPSQSITAALVVSILIAGLS